MATSRSAKAPEKPAASRGVHVALLRGINVGGKNRRPMKELVAIKELVKRSSR